MANTAALMTTITVAGSAGIVLGAWLMDRHHGIREADENRRVVESERMWDERRAAESRAVALR